jgi:hypothetical protein
VPAGTDTNKVAAKNAATISWVASWKRVSKKSVYPSALRYFNDEGVVEQRPGLAAFFAANPGISVRKPVTLKGLRTELGTQPFQGWAVGTPATQG